MVGAEEGTTNWKIDVCVSFRSCFLFCIATSGGAEKEVENVFPFEDFQGLEICYTLPGFAKRRSSVIIFLGGRENRGVMPWVDVPPSLEVRPRKDPEKKCQVK